MLTEITLKSHGANASTRPGRAATVYAVSLSVARKTPTPLIAPHGTRAGVGAPDPAVEAGEEARIRRRPRGPLPPAPHILCFPPARLRKRFPRVTAKGRPEPGEAISVQSRRAASAREGRGGGGSAEGPVFAFISSNRRFYLWKRTDAGD